MMVVSGDWRQLLLGTWRDKVDALMILSRTLKRGVIITLLDSSEDEENLVKEAFQKLGFKVR